MQDSAPQLQSPLLAKINGSPLHQWLLRLQHLHVIRLQILCFAHHVMLNLSFDCLLLSTLYYKHCSSSNQLSSCSNPSGQTLELSGLA